MPTYTIIRHKQSGETQCVLDEIISDEYDVFGQTDDPAGIRIVNGNVVRDLSELEAMLEQVIDKGAYMARSLVATTLPAQTQAYKSKREEAVAFLNGDNVPQGYIHREAALCNMTVQEVAQSVVQKAEPWLALDHEIEGNRIKLKRDMRAAQTEAEKTAIASGFDWKQLVIQTMAANNG